MKRLIAVAIAALAAVSAPVGAPAQAQSRASIAAGGQTQLVNLPRGSSMAVDLPADARDVIVPNPQVAEAMLHSSRRITIIGLAPGETDAVVLDAAGRRILSLRIRVDAGVSALQDTLDRVIPHGRVHAEAVNDSIILSGVVDNPAEADRAVQVARAFVSAPEKVINLTSFAGSDQVTLKVRVIEVQRSAVKQLGFNTRAILDSADIVFSQSPTFSVNGGLLGGGAGGYLDIDGPDTGEATIRAFERVGLSRTLAEPLLTSVNGEAANFLAGGEIPVPTGRDRDGNVTITFKPYGVNLGFRPIVLSGGRISMQISVEVSELSNQGAFTLGAGTDSALTLPAFTTRRVSNTVELPSGGSMMIAGLLQEQSRQAIDALPGVGQVPVLGALFRSRDYLSGETELVVLVEPYIVSPTSPSRMQTPADGLRLANDAQGIFLGQLNQAYGSPEPAAGQPVWSGPVGYVIE